jgi:hypothetical protein
VVEEGREGGRVCREGRKGREGIERCLYLGRGAQAPPGTSGGPLRAGHPPVQPWARARPGQTGLRPQAGAVAGAVRWGGAEAEGGERSSNTRGGEGRAAQQCNQCWCSARHPSGLG